MGFYGMLCSVFINLATLNFAGVIQAILEYVIESGCQAYIGCIFPPPPPPSAGSYEAEVEAMNPETLLAFIASAKEAMLSDPAVSDWVSRCLNACDSFQRDEMQEQVLEVVVKAKITGSFLYTDWSMEPIPDKGLSASQTMLILLFFPLLLVGLLLLPLIKCIACPFLTLKNMACPKSTTEANSGDLEMGSTNDMESKSNIKTRMNQQQSKGPSKEILVVTVPAGAPPGSTIEAILADGRVVPVTIPLGVSADQSIQVSVFAALPAAVNSPGIKSSAPTEPQEVEFDCVVPDHLSPSRTFEADLGGTIVTINVPPDVLPGSTIRVAVPWTPTSI